MTVDMPPGAILLPRPTPEEQREINELMRSPRSYTHPILFYDEEHKPHCGTAVVLRDGDQLFAITAAHNFRENMLLTFRLVNPTSQTRFRILKQYIHPKYDPEPTVSKYDLAILQLEPNSSITAGDVGQLFTGGFRHRTPDEMDNTEFDTTVWVVGNPSELVEPIKDGFVIKQTAFATQIYELDTDQFSLYYPKQVYKMPHDGTTCELGDMTPTPGGYSGGGVWRTTNPSDEFFNPQQHIKLVGIQSHWSNDNRRLLRCVPSKVIIEALDDFKRQL